MADQTDVVRLKGQVTLASPRCTPQHGPQQGKHCSSFKALSQSYRDM